MLGNLGTAEVLIIGVVVLMFFGSKKLNELARGLGESSKEYKKMKREFSSALNEDYNVEDEEDNEEKSDKKVKSKKRGED